MNQYTTYMARPGVSPSLHPRLPALAAGHGAAPAGRAFLNSPTT